MKYLKIISVFALLAIGTINTAWAQPFIDAATAGSGTLQTDGTCNNLWGSITSLNADMVEIISSPSSHTPGAIWGIGLDEYIWAAGYSGVNNGCVNNYSGITVGITPSVTAVQIVEPLPWSGSGIASQIVNHVDVAVGYFLDATPIYSPPIPRYFVLAVYESQGDIYLDHYNVDINYTGPSFTVDVARLFGVPQTNNAQKLNINANNCHYPHISVVYGNAYPIAGDPHRVIGWVVTWEEGGEIWGCDGPISVNSSNNPPPPNNMPFYIDNGKFPDIKGVTAANVGPPDPSIAYVCYLNPNGDEVHLSWWEYGTTSFTNYGAISGQTTNPNEFHYPRIAGPQYFDYSGAITHDPVCVVAVDENDGTSRHKVNTYAFHDPNGTPVVRSVVDASDYSSNGFNGAGYEAMKPVITGAGKIVSNFYMGGASSAYTDYPTVFYADFDYNNSTFTSSGDIYACGTNVTNTAAPPVNLGSTTDYYEVNSLELNFSGHLDMTANEPYIAAATTHNSGYNMFVAYYGGDRIYRRLNTAGNPYGFKPGKTNSIQQLSKSGAVVFPNPVNDRLNVANADGTAYTIMDITGRTISTGTLSGDKATIDASQLAPGMYILQLTKEGHTEKLKFVKQ